MMSGQQNNLTLLTRDEKRGLEGQVAQILNARELVINIGMDQGVREGMTFAIMTDMPIEVHDPETGELLDKVHQEKVRVQAIEVRPRITICQTYRTKTIGTNAYWYLSGSAAAPRQVVETLRLTEAPYPASLSVEESYVKIKDRVVQVPSQPN